MKQEINPVVGIVIAVVVVLGIILVGIKVMNGHGDGGNDGKAVVVKPNDPNDPKFTKYLPKNIAGGGMNNNQ